MDIKEKQRAVIEFLAKEGCAPIDIHRRLKNVYGDVTIDRSNVRRWTKRFNEGETSTKDKERSGRRRTSDSDENRRKINAMIKENRKISITDIANDIHISYGSAQSIIHGLGYKKVCANFVPRLLTEDLKLKRKEICFELLQMFESQNDSFFSNMVTGDETWIFLYDPESINQSMEWRHPSSPRSKKSKTNKSNKKVMATFFWDKDGLILVDFLEQGSTINSTSYVNTLHKLRESIKKKRIKKDVKSIQIHHDNARPHTSFFTNQAIAKMGWSVVPHPPYSPDLAPCDFYLFGHMKDYLRGQRFETIEELKQTVKSWFKNCPPEFFQKAFNDWIRRWRVCIERNGDYVEH